MDPRKHYKILEIDRSASLEEARQAYRDLIAVWHPDRYSHNPRLQKKALEKVKAVNAAFEVVSRFIIENGSGEKDRPEAKNSPAQATVQEKSGATDKRDRTAVWEKTEARLAAMARAKALARAREAARVAAPAKKPRRPSEEDRRETQRRVQAVPKNGAESARLEKKMARERAWAETEQKLRALKLAREKAAQARAGSRAQDKAPRTPGRWYVKQVLICAGILLFALSGNALQTFIYINFTAMLIMIGGGFLAWWAALKIKGRKDLKNRIN